MINKVRYASALIALLAFPLTAMPALSQTVEATPIPMPPKPDFTSMQFLVGTWSCTDKSSRRPAPAQSTLTYALDPEGYWIVANGTLAPTSWFPQGGKTVDRITYDPVTKRWVDVMTDNGGGYDISMSPGGWQNGKIVWHDVSFSNYPDITSTNDNTITKVSDRQTTSASSFKTASGKTVTVTGTCTKQ